MSNSLSIIPVRSKAEFKAFVDLPWEIYKDAPLWVPPIKKQDAELLTPGKHPYWNLAKGQYFLALRDKKIVGRIAAIVDRNYNDYAKQKCGAWGFFECADDQEAAHALFEATANWHKEQGMEFMRGPLTPSTNYTCAMLVEGFELAPCLMMPWNFEYYPRFAETFGMRKEQDLLAYNFEPQKITVPDWLMEQVASIKARNEFTYRSSSKARLKQDIRIMLDLYQKSWADNWGFTPMPLEEAERHVHELKSILDPEFFVLFYHNDKPAGGMLALPDMNPLLKKLNGKLGLSALWHFWKTRNEIKGGYRLVLFGILEEYRLMGLPLLLLDFLINQTKKKKDFRYLEGSWSLEDNYAINELIEDFGGDLNKRYRIYRYEL